MDKSYQQINADTIDQWCRDGWEWGRPITHEMYENARRGQWDVVLTPTKPVPHAWFGELQGKKLLGLASGGAAVASTMAFATLCLSRLFHGFNCKSGRPVLFTRAFWNNKFLLGAFAVGALLLAAVLLIPPLEPLFQVAELSAGLVAAIVGLAFGSMVVIQILKAIRGMDKK